MFWRPLNGCPSFFHISSWSAAHLLQPFHSHLSANDDQHHATPWLATCRDSAAGCHASRPPCKLSDPFLSRIGRHFPTTLASLGRLESWFFFALTFKGVLAFGKMWMWEETGVGWDGQIGTTAKTKKTISTNRESMNSRTRYHHHHLHHHHHRLPASNSSMTQTETSINGNSFQLLLLSAMKSWNKSLMLKQKNS